VWSGAACSRRSPCSWGTPQSCVPWTISTSERVTRIDFCRDAPTLEEAIRSAIGNVNAAGLQVARVEIEADAIATQAT